MAERRQDPRRAPRHTGDVWEAGHQQRPERDFSIDFGPFQGVAHEVPVGGESSYLRECQHAVIKRGMVYPAWVSSTTDLPARNATYPPKTFHIDGQEYLFIPGRLAADTLVISSYDASLTQVDYDTGVALTLGDPVDFTAYGNNLYIVEGSTTIIEYDVSAGTDTQVTGSPSDGQFIFVLDNNLCVIRKVSDIWQVDWSLDGDPSDWSSIGSGSNPLPKELGEIMGYVFLPGKVLIVGRNSAVQMIPTGTLPAFRFQHEPTFPGVPALYCVQASGNRVFYLGRDFRPSVWENGRVQHLGNSAFIVGQNRPAVSLAHELQAIAFGGGFGTATNNRLVFFDLESLEAIAEYRGASTNYAFIGSSPNVAAPALKIFHYGSTSTEESLTLGIQKLGGGTADDPILETHRVHFGHNVIVHRIDILWTQQLDDTASAPDPTVALSYLLEGVTTSVTGNLRGASTDRRMRYDLSVLCDNFALLLSGGTYNFLSAIRQIKVYCSVAAEDDLEVLG